MEETIVEETTLDKVVKIYTHHRTIHQVERVVEINEPLRLFLRFNQPENLDPSAKGWGYIMVEGDSEKSKKLFSRLFGIPYQSPNQLVGRQVSLTLYGLVGETNDLDGKYLLSLKDKIKLDSIFVKGPRTVSYAMFEFGNNTSVFYQDVFWEDDARNVAEEINKTGSGFALEITQSKPK